MSLQDPIDYWITVLPIVGGWAFVLSLVGILVVFSLFRAALRNPPKRQLFLTDILCLSGLVCAACLLIRAVFPPTDKDLPIFTVVYLGVLFVWWWIIVTAMSRCGVVKRIPRCLYQLWVTPFAFISPSWIAWAVWGHQYRDSLGIWLPIIIPIPLYLICWPLTRWIVRSGPGDCAVKTG